MQDYQGLNGQDAHDYHLIAKGYAAWMGGHGARPVMVEHPHGYPIAGAALGELLGNTLLALRLVSAFSLLLLVALMTHLTRRGRPDRRMTTAFVLTMVGTVPFLLRYSMTVMSDVPAIALVFGAFVFSARWLVEERGRLLVLAALFALLAVAVRFAVAPLLGTLMVGVLLLRIRNGKARGLLFGLAVLAVALGVVAWMNWPRLHNTPLRHLVGDWSPLALLLRTHRSDDGLLRYTLPNIIYLLKVVVHPGFVPVGLLLLFLFRREDLRPPHAKLALGLLVVYLLFIGGMPYQNDRVLLMAQPFVVVLFTPAFVRAWERLAGARPGAVLVAGTLALSQLLLFTRAMHPFMQQARKERQLADRVNALHPPAVYTHGMGASLRDLCPGTPVTELWNGVEDRFTTGALLVVRPVVLEQQWSRTAPWINYRRAAAQGMECMECRPDGWCLYRIR